MATQGQVIENPVTGDVYEFLETAHSSDGDRVRLKLTLNTKGEVVPNHFHVLQDEHFEVLNGKLTVLFNGQLKVLQEGERITLPKGIPHNHYNNHDEPCTYIQTVEPALDFEYLLENIIGLTKDGKMPNGKAGLIQELVTLRYLDSKSYLADIPEIVQKILMNSIAPIARFFGYRAVYRKYCGIEK